MNNSVCRRRCAHMNILMNAQSAQWCWWRGADEKTPLAGCCHDAHLSSRCTYTFATCRSHQPHAHTHTHSHIENLTHTVSPGTLLNNHQGPSKHTTRHGAVASSQHSYPLMMWRPRRAMYKQNVYIFRYASALVNITQSQRRARSPQRAAPPSVPSTPMQNDHARARSIIAFAIFVYRSRVSAPHHIWATTPADYNECVLLPLLHFPASPRCAIATPRRGCLNALEIMHRRAAVLFASRSEPFGISWSWLASTYLRLLSNSAPASRLRLMMVNLIHIYSGGARVWPNVLVNYDFIISIYCIDFVYEKPMVYIFSHLCR